MKKNLFKSLFVAAAAMAFVSCVHDDTLDGSKGLYNGPKKTISLSASIAETRTELVDHAILWSDTDTFGLITSADGTTILENIPVTYIRSQADQIEIEVAESAKYIYGYYPYNANLDTENGLANVVIEIPDTYKAGTTDSEAYAPSIDGMFPLLAAKTELPEDDGNVALVFKTADACLVEFNLYGGTDDFEQLISLDLNLDNDGYGASGDFKYDLTGDEPVWSEMYANGYGFVVSFDWYENPSTFQINYPKLKVEKKDGIKVYGVVHKGIYNDNGGEDLWYSPKVTIKTNIQTYICKFNQLDCSADGLTVNINLSSSAIEHPAALAEIISVDAPNTFSADVKIKVDYEKIEWIAVNATNTNDIKRANGAVVKGFDSKEFITTAKSSYGKFEQGANFPSYDNMPYMIYTSSMISDLVNNEDGTITVSDDFLHFLGNQTEGVFDTPGDSNPFAPNASYTVAVYVQPQSSYAKDYPEEIIYTYEWTTPDIVYDGTASVTITEPEVSGANATATVSATNCSKIAAFAMLIDEAAVDSDGETPLTDDQRVDEKRISDLLYWKDNKFKVYDGGEITLTYDNMLVGSRYMFVAVGIDENGLITKPVYKIAQPGSVEMTEEATITGVKIEPQTSLEYLPITITATNASEVRFLAYHSEDYRGLNGTDIQTRLMNLNQGSGGWMKNSGKSGDEFTFNNGQGIYLSGNKDVSSDSEVDATENPGGNTYYIFFAPVVEGSDGWKLGHIKLLTGNGSSYQLYDVTANGNNVSGNYVAAKRTELENAGGGDEEETPNIWGGTADVTLAHYRFNDTYLSYSSYATNFQKGWLLKLASEDEQMKEQATEYRNTSENSIFNTMDEYIFKLRDEAFKNFAETQEPEAQYILETVNTISGTATKYMYPAKTDSSDGWAAGDIYMFVSQDTDGLLCGTWLVLASDNVGVVRKFK